MATAWTWIVGDVHGRHDLLTILLGLVAAQASRGPLVFVGDLIDHGPGSAQVLETVVARRAGAADTVVLPGNHELLLHKALFGPRDQRIDVFRTWLGKGGVAMLRSLDVEPPRTIGRKGDADRLRDDILNRLDPFVRHWLEHRFEAPLWHDVGVGFRVVHAGFRPGVPTERQKPADLLEIREPFLSANRLWDGRIVVHGHTARREPRVEVLPTRINCDVGAGKGVGLAAVAVDGAQICDAVVVRGDGSIRRGPDVLRGRADVVANLMGTMLGAAA